MISPKPHKKPSNKKRSWVKREHFNKKFYDSKGWRNHRLGYIQYLQEKVWYEIPKKIWTLKTNYLNLTDYQSSFILSIGYVPCEMCLKLYLLRGREPIEKGEQLDHIDPVNPENALEAEGWGDPFDYDNLQLLCKTHHSRKSIRDKQLIKAKTNGSK